MKNPSRSRRVLDDGQQSRTQNCVAQEDAEGVDGSARGEVAEGVQQDHRVARDGDYPQDGNRLPALCSGRKQHRRRDNGDQ